MAEYISDKDVAEHFGISWQAVQGYCKSGLWPHMRVGRRYKFSPAHMEQIRKLCEVKPKAAPEDDGWGQKTRRSA